MLKTTGSPDKPAPSRKNGNRSAPSRIDNNKLITGKNNGNGEVDRFGSVEYTKKSEKSKGQKLVRSQKLSKSGILKAENLKKLSKSRNSPNFEATEAVLSFLTPDARTTFNRLRLAFTKALIL